jgi:large subunit ribosomal protein L10
MPSAKNVALVAKLSGQVAQAKSVVLADYRSLTVKEMQNLKSKIRAAGGSLTVAKNTLIKLALKNEALDQVLRGPTALILALEDSLTPIKALVDFAKSHAANLPTPKAGILDDRILTPADITTIASLPSKLELLGQLAGQLQSPLSGLASVLQGNLRQLVYLLSAIKSKKEVN